jgi:hypothetical protein
MLQGTFGKYYRRLRVARLSLSCGPEVLPPREHGLRLLGLWLTIWKVSIAQVLAFCDLI